MKTQLISEKQVDFNQTELVQDYLLPETFQQFMRYENAKMLKCKKGVAVSSQHDADNHFIRLIKRPVICDSDFCSNCSNARQARLIVKYWPYLDDVFYQAKFSRYSLNYLRHIILTTRKFPRSELKIRAKIFYENVKLFHEKMRKSYGLEFRGLVFHDLKYYPEDDSYSYHSHYGILSFVDIKKLRTLWCKTWGDNELVVKYPNDVYNEDPSKRKNPRYRTGKWAYLEYATRRKVEQALVIPQEDFYYAVRHHQNFKRFGYPGPGACEVLFRSITRNGRKGTIRKSLSQTLTIPAGHYLCHLGVLDSRTNFNALEERFRVLYNSMNVEMSDASSPRALARAVFMDIIAQVSTDGKTN